MGGIGLCAISCGAGGVITLFHAITTVVAIASVAIMVISRDLIKTRCVLLDMGRLGLFLLLLLLLGL